MITCMHIQLLTGFISGFSHISGQHRFVGGRASGSYPEISIYLGNMGYFGREPPVLWAFGGVRADGLRREKKGTGGSRKALGAEKAALKILRFTLFVVSQAWDLVEDTLSPKLASSRSLQ